MSANMRSTVRTQHRHDLAQYIRHTDNKLTYDQMLDANGPREQRMLTGLSAFLKASLEFT